MGSSDEEVEGLGEFSVRVRVKASTRFEEDESLGDDEDGAAEGPKIILSLSSDGVKGIEISSFSGKGKSGDGWGLLGLILTNGKSGSFSIYEQSETTRRMV